jgi:phosphinothricin acetyltransferase
MNEDHLEDDPEKNTPVTIRGLTLDDWVAVEAIYAAGISTGNATFETETPSWEQFDATKLVAHRFVAVDVADIVLGWVAVARVSARHAYRGVVEHSLYVAPDWANRGVGTALLNAVIASTEASGIWTIQSGIFPENEASLALHRRQGFRVIGTRERVGEHHGNWRDVVLIERRSAAVGA